jgi:hypothetical protein
MATNPSKVCILLEELSQQILAFHFREYFLLHERHDEVA